METERELSLKSLNELLWLFMRQAAVEGAARRPAMRRASAIEVRADRQGIKRGKAS